MVIYRSRKGKHDFRPWTPFWKAYRNPKVVTCKVSFGEGTDYNILPDRDQYDYSKLEGLAFSAISNRRNSIMFGWNFDPKTNKYRVAGYINEKNKHRATPYIEVTKNQIVDLSFKIGRDLVEFDLHGTKFVLSKKFRTRIGRRIGMYFGGNKPSPQVMTICSSFTVKRKG